MENRTLKRNYGKLPVKSKGNATIKVSEAQKRKALNSRHTVGSERREDAPWPFASQQPSFKFNTPGFFKKYDFLLRFIFSFNNTV